MFGFLLTDSHFNQTARGIQIFMNVFYIKFIGKDRKPASFKDVKLDERQLGTTDKDGNIAFYSQLSEFSLYLAENCVYTGEAKELPHTLTSN